MRKQPEHFIPKDKHSVGILRTDPLQRFKQCVVDKVSPPWLKILCGWNLRKKGFGGFVCPLLKRIAFYPAAYGGRIEWALNFVAWGSG